MFGNNKRIVFLNFRRTVFVRLFYFLSKTKTLKIYKSTAKGIELKKEINLAELHYY